MKEYRISIQPRILQLLGPNLYTNVYYVLAELIANAYDAGAHNVYLIIENDAIVIEDDGKGMSYENGEVGRYLRVAEESRTSEKDELVPGTQRRKMGRKGVGKLAALSVSDDVFVYTRTEKEVSGFILSVNVGEDKLLKPIPEEEVNFRYVEGSGTAIVMPSPRYTVHKTISVIKKNLVKIFPQLSDEFQIHVIKGKQRETIDKYDEEVVRELGGLITLGRDFSHLGELLDPELSPDENDKFFMPKGVHREYARLEDNQGEMRSIELEVKGWIGFFRTTAGRKKAQEEFPDNAISIISHGKVGEYNILPLVGKNYVAEAFIVGQLHVEAFEDSNFPDMALSNRQGYKYDDPRYQKLTKYVRESLLPEVFDLRNKYAAIKKSKSDKKKNQSKRENEKKAAEQLRRYKEKTAGLVVERLKNSGYVSPNADDKKIITQVEKDINRNLPDAGLKATIDGSKKKVLVSHCSANKTLCDLIVDLLLFCGVRAEEILYTSSEEAEMRIPNGADIYEYIRDFFVSSASTQMMFVIYVTSAEMRASWDAVCEVGAGWVARSDHEIFNIYRYTPSSPLNVRPEWHTSKVKGDEITMSRRSVDVMAEKMTAISDKIGAGSRTKDEVKRRILKAVVLE